LNAFAELSTKMPEELVDEFLKRVPYVSEGICNVRLLPGATRVEFDLRAGFDEQADLVRSRISQVAGKLCLNYRPGICKTLANQTALPSSFSTERSCRLGVGVTASVPGWWH
jgi:hypothetical protein